MRQVARKVSEIRTDKQDLIVSSKRDQQTLRQLEIELEQEWFALKRKRHEVGRILKQIQQVLAEEGSFAEFLRGKGIPRSTAYDLIGDYERWTKLPQPIRQAAERQNVDLSERKFSSALKPLYDLNEDSFTPSIAAVVVKRISEHVKRARKPEISLPSLSRDQRQVSKAFQAINNALGNLGPTERVERMSELMGYVISTLGIDRHKVSLEPQEPPVWLFTGIGEDESQ